MTVAEWAHVFFAELSKRVGRSIPYTADADGNFESRDPELRVVGCNDDFMSVWTSKGVAWDDKDTRQGAIDAASILAE